MNEGTRQAVLETGRLILRELHASDLEWVWEMLSDDEVMRFYPRPLDRVDSYAWIQRQRKRYRRDGFGLWAAVLEATDTPVGQVGLARQSVLERERIEVGYLLRRSFWGQGYAIEAARACRDHAFDALQTPEVISMIRPANERSIAVALRNGMQLERTVMWRGLRHGIYRVDNENSVAGLEHPGAS